MNWNTEQRKISDLIRHETNPRQMSDEQNQALTESLKRFNLAEIPAINTNNKILAGHQRLRVLSELGRGQDVIDVRVPDRELTADEEKEYLVRSNKNVGSWDWDLLGNDYDLDQLSEWGFSDKDFDFLLIDEEETTGTGAKKECQCPECGHKF